MKKNIIIIALGLIFCIASAFKNVSIFALDEVSNNAYLPVLAGKWQILEDTTGDTYVDVHLSNYYYYSLTLVKNRFPVPGYTNSRAFFSQIDSLQFLNVAVNADNIRGYYFFKISDLDTNKLTLTLNMIQDTTLDQFSSRQAVRDYVQRNTTNPDFYGYPMHLRKLKN